MSFRRLVRCDVTSIAFAFQPGDDALPLEPRLTIADPHDPPTSLTINRVARRVRASPAFLSQTFKKAYGMPPVQYRHFLYGAVSTSLIPADRREPTPTLRVSQEIARYVRDTREGLSFGRSQHGLLTLLFTFASVNVLFMPVLVLLPLDVGFGTL